MTATAQTSAETPKAPSRRIDSVHTLRAIACLLVAFCHFTNAHENFLGPSIWKDALWHGRVGVQIFFVISGFVIAHSLIVAGYAINDFPRFVAKRLIRLEPVYLVMVAYLALRVRLVTGQLDWAALGLHLGYLIPFSHKPWLSIIFWTLAIEFQFYIMFGLLFPAFLSRRRLISNLMLVAFALSSLALPDPNFLFHWGPFFVLGIVISLWFSQRIMKLDALAIGILAAALCFITETPIKASAGVLGAAAIFVLSHPVRLLSFYGDISYSLYLVHVPAGLAVISLAEKWGARGFQKLLAIFAALAVSTIAAWALWKFVEEPSRRLSHRVPLRKLQRAAAKQ